MEQFNPLSYNPFPLLDCPLIQLFQKQGELEVTGRHYLSGEFPTFGAVGYCIPTGHMSYLLKLMETIGALKFI